MSSLDSVMSQIELFVNDEDEETAMFNTYKHSYDYYTSSDAVNQFKEGIKQLKKKSLNSKYQWLLFDAFHLITNDTFYNDEKRDKLCEIWLPIYESTLKEILSEDNINHLNIIKYLLANLIEIQRTLELKFHFIKKETQFENLKQKNEYFNIIKLVLPLLINSSILKQIENNIKLKWEDNDYSNTLNVTSTYTLWIILKFMLMFIKTDGDCLTMIKHDQNIKNILLESIKLIKDDNQLKLSIYANVALLLNEDNIKNDINDSKQIILALTSNLKKVQEEDTEESKPDDDDTELSTDGVFFTDILVALKAFLQHDQVKNLFVENGGLELLIDLIKESSEFSVADINSQDELMAELKPESEKDIQEAQQFVEQFNQAAQNEMSQMIKEAKVLALESLYTMSFNQQAADILNNNQEFISQITKIDKEDNTNNERLKKAVDGLLWKLKKEDQFKEQQNNNNKQNDQFDFMISYSWSDKPLVQQIYKYLTEQLHFNIWLDENQMAGSLCQAMAQAVEKSKFILMCMSEKYKASENCRNEAEYARDRKKTIIPLVMKNVERDGWLGFISAGKMYIDFTKQDFDKAVQLLKAEIERNQREKGEPIQKKEKSSDVTASIPQTTPVPVTSKLPVHPNVISNAYKKIPIESWSEQHVQDFLYDNKLDVMILLTEYMNGEELQHLSEKCQKQQDYWIMFDRLNHELEKRHQQTLSISVYLRFLNRIQKYTSVSSF